MKQRIHRTHQHERGYWLDGLSLRLTGELCFSVFRLLPILGLGLRINVQRDSRNLMFSAVPYVQNEIVYFAMLSKGTLGEDERGVYMTHRSSCRDKSSR